MIVVSSLTTNLYCGKVENQRDATSYPSTIAADEDQISESTASQFQSASLFRRPVSYKLLSLSSPVYNTVTCLVLNCNLVTYLALPT